MYIHCFLDAEDVDRIALMRVFAILQHNDPRDSIIYVAATGDVPTLRKCLEKHPGEVHVHVWLPSVHMRSEGNLVVLSVCLFVLIRSTNDIAYLTHKKGVRFSLKLLCFRARVTPALYGNYVCRPFSPTLISACAFCVACTKGSALQCMHLLGYLLGRAITVHMHMYNLVFQLTNMHVHRAHGTYHVGVTFYLLCMYMYVAALIQINRKLHGRTAVHVACTEGYIGCLKLLLTYNPDLELMVRIS